MHMGIATCSLNETDAGLERIESGLAAWSNVGAFINRSYWLAGMAQGELAAGRAKQAIALFDQAIESIDQTDERYFEPYIRHLRGVANAALEPPRLADAEVDFKDAIRVAREQNAKMLELRATNSLFALLRAQQREVEVAADLESLYGLFSEGFAAIDLEEAERNIAADWHSN